MTRFRTTSLVLLVSLLGFLGSLGSSAPTLHAGPVAGGSVLDVGSIDSCDISDLAAGTAHDPLFVGSPAVPPTESVSICIPASKCCKICRKGKACGDTCINRSYNCSKGRGCACNSEEVCED